MSDDAQTPGTQGGGADRPTPTGGAGEPADAPRDPWAAPVRDGSAGPGATVADTGSLIPPTSTPSSSVHDQQTVTSMPGVGGPEASKPWSSPVTPSDPSSARTNGSDNPFAPPNPAAPVNPGQASPYPPPGSAPVPPYVQDAVPPPPMAPDGPGHVPYGYPGPSGYGYPAPPGYGGHGPQSQGPGAYYGWPGMAPAPNNGMGTASMVVGIVSAVGFCMWPIAIIGGIVAVVLGVIARQKVRRGESTNAGQALAGIICGSVGLALAVGMIAVLAFAA